MVLNQELIANYGLTGFWLWGCSLPTRVKTEPCTMLEEACLVLAPGILLLPTPVGNPFCQRQRPKSGVFVWLTVFQYHLMGAT
jgi:hypothetical protein